MIQLIKKTELNDEVVALKVQGSKFLEVVNKIIDRKIEVVKANQKLQPMNESPLEIKNERIST